ncbi:CYTH domain-containing protein [Microbacterium hominis]|uniref:CYTH domain-containing protein n=1 Tax=Microbacterium hominis TaxID=162426 RepID=A0A7D4UGI0_9MICO|nr:CYTH domain-containing protein [Microbacterium hominis]QKJ19689.1 CYTH domain-containing protein [Microbacterium hominis]
MSEPVRSLEIELKFDVGPHVTGIPEWFEVPGVEAVSAADPRNLDALYLDTVDATLGRAGYAVRRRTGGPDEGWHIKGPKIDGARVELQWPLGEGGADDVPAAVRAALAGVLPDADAALVPLARIRNERMAYHLLSSDGEVVAEFADDHVYTRDERSGIEREWREWEIELGAAGPVDARDREAFFEAVTVAAHAAGAGAATSASKLARALGV